ncbi:chemotaxis protein CheW [Marinobacter sp. F4206]|uniref:chemotaxis protein CheW n=1 Tax=Marinobacter sp. F4206 TaxID=2861777 RepID=UPI001C5CC515|nr:chemotaxis protein CheW [Marinobacter sp. F4206]MBW4933686.1 chemotaxis protein CheW [Marinobacter sp. F4206]
MADENLTRLSDPASAIASYLDDLLHTATDTALREESVVEVPVREVRAEAPVKAVPETKPEPPVAGPKVVERAKPEPAIAEARAVEAPEPAVVASPEIEPQPETAEPSSRPEWSGAPFECLIFTVAGLQLAVPLILLGAIHRVEEEIRPIPGSPRWYMGIRPDRDQNLRVVDTAEWIMAGRVPDNARDNYRFVIRLDNSDWGLACDDVAQSFTLRPDEVRWRTARSKRPWLAGTVIDHMCALIDVRTMADLLVRAEREHHLDLS